MEGVRAALGGVWEGESVKGLCPVCSHERLYVLPPSGDAKPTFECGRGCRWNDLRPASDWYVQEVYIGGLTDPELRALLAPANHVDVQAVKNELKVLRERLDIIAEDYAAGLLTRSQLQTGTERTRQLIRKAEDSLGRAVVDLPEPGDFTAMSVHARRKLLDDAFDIRVLPRGKGNGGMSPDDFVIRPKAHPEQRIWMPTLDVPAEFKAYTVLRRNRALRQ